jgi:hypothetical protein
VGKKKVRHDVGIHSIGTEQKLLKLMPRTFLDLSLTEDFLFPASHELRLIRHVSKSLGLSLSPVQVPPWTR